MIHDAGRGPGPLHRLSHPAVALVLVVPAPVVGVVAAMILWPGPAGQLVFFLAKAWMLGLPLVWRLLIERKGPSLSPPRRGGFVPAALLGLAIGVVIVAAYALAVRRWIDLEHVRAIAGRNGIGTAGRYLLGAAFWIAVNSVLEEYVYRWFVFRRFEMLLPAPVAVVASAACFTAHHVIALRVQFGWPATALASAGVFIGGSVWSWLYLRYRSIWPGYLSHAIVDVVVFALGYRILFG